MTTPRSEQSGSKYLSSSSSSVPHPQDDESGYVECPLEECGEIVGFSDMDLHLELHSQQDHNAEVEEFSDSPSRRSSLHALESQGFYRGTRHRSSRAKEREWGRHSHHRHDEHGYISKKKEERDREHKHEERLSLQPKPSSTSPLTNGDRHKKTIQEWKDLFSKTALKGSGQHHSKMLVPSSGSSSGSFSSGKGGTKRLGVSGETQYYLSFPTIR